jgi:hypothetical protein
VDLVALAVEHKVDITRYPLRLHRFLEPMDTAVAAVVVIGFHHHQILLETMVVQVVW